MQTVTKRITTYLILTHCLLLLSSTSLLYSTVMSFLPGVQLYQVAASSSSFHDRISFPKLDKVNHFHDFNHSFCSYHIHISNFHLLNLKLWFLFCILESLSCVNVWTVIISWRAFFLLTCSHAHCSSSALVILQKDPSVCFPCSALSHGFPPCFDTCTGWRQDI